LSPSRQFPPLSVWYGTAGIIAVLLVFLANEDRIPALAHHITAASDANLNLERLTVPAPPSAVRIVALGSSKTLYAVDFDANFAARLGGSQAVDFERITWEGANFWDVQPALRALAAHPPDILLLESDLLLLDRGAHFPIRQNLLPLERALHQVLVGDSGVDPNFGENRGAEQFPDARECRIRQTQTQQLIYAAHLKTTRPSSSLSRQRYLDMLGALQKAGTRIILVRLPRAAWAEALVPSSLARIDSVILPQLARDNGFQLWSAAPLPDSAFCDEGHMSAAGRELFSQWLAGKLMAARANHG